MFCCWKSTSVCQTWPQCSSTFRPPPKRKKGGPHLFKTSEVIQQGFEKTIGARLNVYDGWFMVYPCLSRFRRNCWQTNHFLDPIPDGISNPKSHLLTGRFSLAASATSLAELQISFVCAQTKPEIIVAAMQKFSAWQLKSLMTYPTYSTCPYYPCSNVTRKEHWSNGPMTCHATLKRSLKPQRSQHMSKKVYQMEV